MNTQPTSLRVTRGGAAKKISRNVKIPGFRPGKAPYSIIVNHYGEAAIVQEAIDILLEDDYGKILDEQEIKPSGSGNLEKIESYDPPKVCVHYPFRTRSKFRRVSRDPQGLRIGRI